VADKRSTPGKRGSKVGETLCEPWHRMNIANGQFTDLKRYSREEPQLAVYQLAKCLLE
jgi:hypothetical protein